MALDERRERDESTPGWHDLLAPSESLQELRAGITGWVWVRKVEREDLCDKQKGQGGWGGCHRWCAQELEVRQRGEDLKLIYLLPWLELPTGSLTFGFFFICVFVCLFLPICLFIYLAESVSGLEILLSARLTGQEV